ncbi:MAG: hypothetical protein JSW26_09075 [Desulfobacterales bacterium]|nr:MAG: hypothetical protein JSW26_09075 [Desulfobacterales bacterium]
MNWKFWQKKNSGASSAGVKEVKLARPKELPDRVGMHLVSRMKEDPDWVWNLRCAMRPKSDEKHVFEIRIFSPADADRKGVVVANFNTLDAHPDMIIFSGSFNKSDGTVQLEKTLKKVA